MIPAPAPAPVAPTPAPAPASVKKVEAPAPKEEKKDAGKPPSKRRRGVMPLWLAEILVLSSFVGVGLAATKYSKESSAVLKAVGQKVVEAYSAAEKLISKPKPSA